MKRVLFIILSDGNTTSAVFVSTRTKPRARRGKNNMIEFLRINFYQCFAKGSN